MLKLTDLLINNVDLHFFDILFSPKLYKIGPFFMHPEKN